MAIQMDMHGKGGSGSGVLTRADDESEIRKFFVSKGLHSMTEVGHRLEAGRKDYKFLIFGVVHRQQRSNIRYFEIS